MKLYARVTFVLAEPYAQPDGRLGYRIIDQNLDHTWLNTAEFLKIYRRLDDKEYALITEPVPYEDQINRLFNDAYMDSDKDETADKYFSSEYPYELRQVGDSAEFLGNDGKWHPITEFDERR